MRQNRQFANFLQCALRRMRTEAFNVLHRQCEIPRFHLPYDIFKCAGEGFKKTNVVLRDTAATTILIGSLKMAVPVCDQVKKFLLIFVCSGSIPWSERACSTEVQTFPETTNNRHQGILQAPYRSINCVTAKTWSVEKKKPISEPFLFSPWSFVKCRFYHSVHYLHENNVHLRQQAYWIVANVSQSPFLDISSVLVLKYLASMFPDSRYQLCQTPALLCVHLWFEFLPRDLDLVLELSCIPCWALVFPPADAIMLRRYGDTSDCKNWRKNMTKKLLQISSISFRLVVMWPVSSPNATGMF